MEYANSKFDIDLGDAFELTDNKYRNRRNIREMLNAITDRPNSFTKSKADGWKTCIKADMHVIDRFSDREFPIDEFFQVVAKVISRHEGDLLKLVNERYNNTDFNPLRINCYGHGAWMVGVSISIYANGEGEKSYHVNIRTCYKERNMVDRERVQHVEKIWTRGLPHWMKQTTDKSEEA